MSQTLLDYLGKLVQRLPAALAAVNLPVRQKVANVELLVEFVGHHVAVHHLSVPIEKPFPLITALQNLR